MGNGICGKSQKSTIFSNRMISNSENTLQKAIHSNETTRPNNDFEKKRQSIDQGTVANKKSKANLKAIDRKPKMIQKVDISDHFQTLLTKKSIIQTDDFKLLEISQTNESASDLIVLAKSKFQSIFDVLLRLMEKVNRTGIRIFIDEFEIFEDSNYFYILSKKYERVLGKIETTESKKVLKFIGKFEAALSWKEEQNDLMLILNPLNLVFENDKILLNPFYAFFEWFSKEKSFAEKLFYPSEYILSKQLNSNSIHFTIALNRLLFDQNQIFYNYFDFNDFLSKNRTNSIEKTLNSDDAKDYYGPILKTLPDKRISSVKFRQGVPQKVKQNLEVVNFLNTFAYFCAEMENIIKKYKKIQAQFSKLDIGLGESIHYLTAEEIFRLEIENDPNHIFEDVFFDLSGVTFRKMNKKQESITGKDLSDEWLNSKKLCISKKYKDKVDNGVKFQKEINLKSYLDQAKELNENEISELVSLFNALF